MWTFCRVLCCFVFKHTPPALARRAFDGLSLHLSTALGTGFGDSLMRRAVGQTTFGIGIDGEVSPCGCAAAYGFSKSQRLPNPNRRIGVVGGIHQL